MKKIYEYRPEDDTGLDSAPAINRCALSVADVSSFGGSLKQYEVSIDPERLRSYNLSIAELFDALGKNNQNTGGAYIDKQPNACSS